MKLFVFHFNFDTEETYTYFLKLFFKILGVSYRSVFVIKMVKYHDDAFYL